MNARVYGATTALVMVMALPAYANNNHQYLIQTGNFNSSSIIQHSEYAQYARAGEATIPLQQIGNNNTLTFTQGGASNRIGNKATGFRQLGNNNYAKISQGLNGEAFTDAEFGVVVTDRSSVNEVNTVTQKSEGDAGNKLVITQNSGRAGLGGYAAGGALGSHVVGTVTQTAVSTGNIATIAQEGLRHKLNSLTQIGSANKATSIQQSRHNVIGSIAQNGDWNSARVLQRVDSIGSGMPEGVTNAGNLLSSASQTGSVNTLALSFTGKENGGIYHSSSNIAVRPHAAGSNAPAASTASQTGDYNELWASFIGSQNSYGFAQTGDMNRMAAQVYGDGNSVVSSQIGDGNYSYAVVAGSYNTLSVSLTGDHNNTGTLSTSLANTASGLSIYAGDAIQSGDHNEMSLTSTGDNNITAALQYGDNNSLTFAGLGNGTQAVFGQRGDGNVIQSTSNGNNNFISVVQTGNGNTSIGFQGVLPQATPL